MKLYLSGDLVVYPKLRLRQFLDEHFPDVGILVSYAYQEDFYSAIDQGYKTSNIMIDSGAFSAETKGYHISIDEYTEFLLQHKGQYGVAVSLDVIFDSQTSKRNWDYMNKRIQTMPVWHIQDPLSLLDYYVSESDHVGIAGIAIAKLKYKDVLSYFDRIFDRFPTHKFHVFGVNSISMLRRFPFCSCDSTLWMVGAVFGSAITPFGRVQVTDRKANNSLTPDIVEWFSNEGLDVPVSADITPYYLNLFNIKMLHRLLVEEHSGVYKPVPINNFLF